MPPQVRGKYKTKRRGQRKQRKQQDPEVCPICGADLRRLSCAACGAELHWLTDEYPAPEVVIQGTVSQRTGFNFDMLLPGDVVVHVETDDETSTIHRPLVHPTGGLREGVEVQAVGRAGLTFEEHLGGPREAPAGKIRLHARMVALGPGCGQLLQQAVERIERGQGVLQEPPEPRDEAPEGVRAEIIEPRPDRLQLRIVKQPERGWLSPWLFLAIMAVTVSLNVIGLGTPRGHLAGGLLLVLAALLAYPWLVSLNRTVIRVDEQSISVGPAPFPWFGGWRRPSGDVVRLQQQTRPDRSAPKVSVNSLWVEFAGGERRPLLRDAGDRQIAHVKQTIEGVLGLAGVEQGPD